MVLKRVHREEDNTEEFGPAKLGPQDLRDIAAIFAELDAKAKHTLKDSTTDFRFGDHTTTDIEDVLSYPESETLRILHVMSGEMLIALHLAPTGTTIERFGANRHDARVNEPLADAAVAQLRAIVKSRQVGSLAAARQRGPGKWVMFLLLAVPVVMLVAVPLVLDIWFSESTSRAVGAGLIWLSVLPTYLLMGRSKALIRLRGQERPWWERRQGLISLVGLVLAVVIPFTILGLESRGK